METPAQRLGGFLVTEQELKKIVEYTVKEIVDQLGLETAKNTQKEHNNTTKEEKCRLKETKETKETKEKTAYQKTEQLLYNYNAFKKIVEERYQEIEEIKKYGVPKKGSAVVEYGKGGGTVQGIVLPEESVEVAVRTVQDSVQGTVQAIAMIDKCMSLLKNDPYYKILEMRYIEGRTLEDIALEYGCSHVTISKNKSRLIRELSIKLFPDQVVHEMMN